MINFQRTILAILLVLVAIVGARLALHVPAPSVIDAPQPVQTPPPSAPEAKAAANDLGAPTALAVPPAFVDSEAKIAPPEDKKVVPPAVPESPAQKTEIAWMDMWHQHFPEPGTVEMDMRDVASGGKPKRREYEPPAPLTVGQQVVDDNGKLGLVYSDRVVYSDGSTARIDGDRLYKNDGTLGVRIGNEVLWSDGSKSSY